jgi:hypothetical protein
LSRATADADAIATATVTDAGIDADDSSSAGQRSSRLALSANNQIKMDRLSKSDPMIAVFRMDPDTRDFVLVSNNNVCLSDSDQLITTIHKI